MTYIFDQSQKILKQEIAYTQDKFSEADMGEEKQSAVGELYEMYNEAVDMLGTAYGTFLSEFKQEIPEQVLVVIAQIASQMLTTGTKSSPSITVTNQGVVLFSDFARYLEADVAKSLFENAIDPIIALLNQITEDNVNNTAVMVRSVYYTF